MKKSIFLLVFVAALQHSSFAQIPWSLDTIASDKIEWNNYSTSYVGDIKDSIPFIVTAISSSYTGRSETVEDMNMPLDLSFNGSLFAFKSNLLDKTRKIYTTDSSAVYFLTPGIYSSNAARYEYRVSLNAKTVIKPWGHVETFSDLQLNNFKKGFGYLGGYKTTWGNFIIVEIRKKGTDSVLSSAVIYWKETKPRINSIYTTKNLNDFFKSLTRPWDKTIVPTDVSKGLVLDPEENNIIFSIAGEIYKKEALEYSLTKDGETVIDWKPNDFDNNFIWFKTLPYGRYVLKVRFAKQRHNITEYKFEVKTAWYQAVSFKIIAAFIIIASLSSVVLLLRLRKQKKKLVAEQQQKEKAETELKTLRAQLNPHFVFNSLSSIQGLINNNEIENANKYLSDFANLMRTTLTASDKNNNNLTDEIKALENYLQLEQLRFHFQYSIYVDEAINPSTTEIPSLLLQPLVENAVKHGVSGQQEKGVIQIKFTQQEKDLAISVTDNGNGFAHTEKNNGVRVKAYKEQDSPA
ncbi:MAG: histidine kinase [Bacteroidota bacterium]